MLRAHLSLLTLSLGLPWYWRTEPTHLGVERVALSIEVMLVEELHPPDVIDSHGRCSSRSSLVSNFVLSISIYLFTYLPTYITHLYLSISPTYTYLYHPPLHAAVVVVLQLSVAALLVPRVERVVANLQG